MQSFFYFYNDYIEVPEEVFLKYNQEVESIKVTDPKLINKYTSEINSHREIRLKERFKLVEEDLKIKLVENKKKNKRGFWN